MRLIEEYKGKKITVKTATGFITFDTDKTDESEYEMYSNLGFDFCFEPVEQKYKKPIAYVGIKQEENLIKPNKKKNAKKVKTETKKE